MHLTFIDTESAWDEVLHEQYRQLNPRKHQQRRTATKRIFAAAALDIVIDADGKTSIAGLTSWTEHSHGTEEAIVSEVFDHLRFRPAASVVSWGGLATDVPILMLAAMEYELSLPPQLTTKPRTKWGQARPHCDLALELKGQGREWAHMSEIGLRIGLPATLFEEKSRIDLPQSDESWAQARNHVEFDTILLALICLAWRRIHSQIRGDWIAMAFQVIDWYLRNRAPGERLSKSLSYVRQSMIDRLHVKSLQ